MNKGKTITTYLIDGHPNGIRTCFISNKICKAVVVPRSKLMPAKKTQRASSTGVVHSN